MTRQLLGDVVTFVRGVTFDGGEASPIERTEAVPILRAGNIGVVLDTSTDLVWVPTSRMSYEQRMHPGDIAICMSSGSPAVVGKTALLDHRFDGSVGAFCGIVRAGPSVHPPYLALWFRSGPFIRWRNMQSRGASIQNLRFSELAQLGIDLPDLDGQRRSAAMLHAQLSEVAKSADATNHQLAEVRVAREVIVAAAFEGVLTANQTQLGRTGWLDDGDWILTADYSPSGVRLFQVGDVGSGTLLAKSSRFVSVDRAEELGCTLLRPGDVLISRMPEPIGRACIVPDLGYPAITAVDVTIYRPDPAVVDSEFIVQYLNSGTWLSEVASKASGATRARISRANLELLRVPMPELSVQRTIAADLRARIVSIDAIEASIRRQREAIDVLPAALLRQAFEETAA